MEKDQSRALKVFGGLLMAGAFISLLTKIKLIIAAASNPTNSIAVYSLLIGFSNVIKLACFGWGSWKARRWARVLIIIESGFMMVSGIMTLPVVLWGLSRLDVPSPKVTIVLMVFTAATLFVTSILIPFIFFQFYRKTDVQETCERRNPEPSWTDKVPMPVLILMYCFLLAAFYTFVVACTPGTGYPFLKWNLSGGLAFFVPTCMAVLMVYAVLELYSLKRAWTIWLSFSIPTLNSTIFFGFHGMNGMMSLIPKSPTIPVQMEAMVRDLLWVGAIFGFVCLVTWVAGLIYIQRKYISKTSFGAI